MVKQKATKPERVKKYNWVKLEKEYLASDYDSISEFFKNKHPDIPYKTNFQSMFYQSKFQAWQETKNKQSEQALQEARLNRLDKLKKSKEDSIDALLNTGILCKK